MPEEPVLTRIAFVVDEGASPGHEIQFVATCLNGGDWMPPISCTTRKHAEYWRKAFLLVARYLERLRTHGPLEEWMTINGLPVLIHEQQTNYRHWKFLAKYWHEKKGTLKRSVEEPASRLLRAQQLAITACFRPFGTRGISPWIAIGSPLPSDAVLLYSGPIKLWPSEIKGTDPFPEAGLESKRIQSEEEIRSTCVRLASKIRDVEIASRREKKLRNDPLAGYRQVLHSQIPEYVLPCSVLEGIPQQQFGTNQRPRSLPAPLSLSGLLSHATKSDRRILITGQSGSGKTTLLRLMASDFLVEEHPLSSLRHAILVNLNRFEPMWHASFEDLVLESIRFQFLRTGLELTLKQVESIAGWLGEEEAKSEATLYLLDGYNEVPREHRFGVGRFEQLLEQFLRTCKGPAVISTVGDDMPLSHRPSIYELQEPDDAAIKAFVDSRLGNACSARFSARVLTDSQYRSLAKNPYLLNALINIALQNPESAQLPDTRAAVLAAIVQDSLSRKFRREELPRPASQLSDLETISILTWLAHETIRHPDRQILYPTCLMPRIADPFARMALTQAAILAGFIEPIEFDGTTRNQRILFSHDLLRDYFAGRFLHETTANVLVTTNGEYLEHYRWGEALCIFAELFQDKRLLAAGANQIAQADVVLATEFAIRGKCLTTELVAGLIRALAYRSQFDAQLDIDILRAKCLSVYVAELDYWGKDIIRLLASLNAPILVELYQTVPSDSSLSYHIAMAVGMKGPSACRSLCERMAMPNPNLEILLIKGLAYEGSQHALRSALELFRAGVRRRLESGETDNYFSYACRDAFSNWNSSLPADESITLVANETDRVVQSGLCGLLGCAKLEPRHIGDLLPLAYLNLGAMAGPVLGVIGRVGGSDAIAAILQFVKDFVAERIGANAQSMRKWGDFGVVFEALTAAHGEADALPRLLELLHSNPSESHRASPTPSADRSFRGWEWSWNMLVIQMFEEGKLGLELKRLLKLKGCNAMVLDRLTGIARNKVLYDYNTVAEETLAWIECIQRPMRVWNAIGNGLLQSSKRPKQYGVYGIGEDDWLAYWGMQHLSEVLGNLPERDVSAVSRSIQHFAATDDIDVRAAVPCARFLLRHGGVPTGRLQRAALKQLRETVEPLKNRDEEWLVSLAHGLPDAALLSIIRELRPNEDPKILSDLFSRNEDWAGRIGANHILRAKGRRFLQELEGWPGGGQSTPDWYKPKGFDEFAVTLRQTFGDVW